MSRPISWFRLFRGKVWHVGFAQDAAACGSERPADAETVGERAPVNARVCGDCVAAALHLYGLAQSAQMANVTPIINTHPEPDGQWHVSRSTLPVPRRCDDAIVVNGVEYLIPSSEWEPSLPEPRSTWLTDYRRHSSKGPSND